MSTADIEQAAMRLPEDELIDLVGRLYERINRPADSASAKRITLADEREKASELDPDGDSGFEEFLDGLKAVL